MERWEADEYIILQQDVGPIGHTVDKHRGSWLVEWLNGALGRTMQPKPTVTIDQLWAAIFACASTQDTDKITLHYDGVGKNPSAELRTRLEAVLGSNPVS